MKIIFLPLESLPKSYSSLLRKWRNSPSVRSQMLNQKEVSEEEHLCWYEGVISDSSMYRVRVAFGDGIPFGIIYLKDIDYCFSVSSWGLYIGEESYRGFGFGRTMLASLLIWGFEELALFRMYTSVLSGNKKALDLYHKAGFQVEGVWRKHLFCGETRRMDLVWIGMLFEEWKENKEKITNWLNEKTN